MGEQTKGVRRETSPADAGHFGGGHSTDKRPGYGDQDDGRTLVLLRPAAEASSIREWDGTSGQVRLSR